MSGPGSLLHEIVRIFEQELSRPQYLWQLAVICAALAGGWFLNRLVQQGVAARVQAQSREPSRRVDLLRFSIDGFRRLAFPVSVMALLILGGLVLRAAGLVSEAKDLVSYAVDPSQPLMTDLFLD